MSDLNFISYKDDAARVIIHENKFYRYIFTNYSREYDHLMKSGLYKDLVSKGEMVSHVEVQIQSEDPKIYKCILPEQIEFQSYPYEWPFIQWKKAILTYLSINKTALKYGMILKDATPFNFCHVGGKAILIDTSSFIFFKEPGYWNAYRQFCEEFLGPIVLMKFNGPSWAKLSGSMLGGMPLPFISKQLHLKTWLNLTTLINIHWHARFSAADLNPKHEGEKKTIFTIEKINYFIDTFKNSIDNWNKPYQFKKKWLEYYEEGIESKEYLAEKELHIANWLQQINPKSVVDLGANTGRFTFLAAKNVEKVIALESDYDCVSQIEEQISKSGLKNIFLATSELSNPESYKGILNKEFLPIFLRAKCEMTFALALVHHLFFTHNMNIGLIIETLSNMCEKYLVVEFIPKEDEKVKLLTRFKNMDTSTYSKSNFLAVLDHQFLLIEEKKIIGSNRTLLLLKKRNNEEIK